MTHDPRTLFMITSGADKASVHDNIVTGKEEGTFSSGEILLRVTFFGYEEDVFEIMNIQMVGFSTFQMTFSSYPGSIFGDQADNVNSLSLIHCSTVYQRAEVTVIGKKILTFFL